MNSIIKVMILLIMIMFARSVLAANYPLEIIQPQEGLDTKNRFYKAYPGLEYNIRISVIGGSYPFTHELVTCPTGMTIDTNTGEILWPDPTIKGSPHSVSVKVADQEGSIDTVSWNITVTESGFKFLDTINGKSVEAGGMGTLENPWKSIADMYEGKDYSSKNKNSYANNFLYFKNGAYNIGDAFLEDVAGDGTGRLPVTGYNKPLVWLAYPGQTPVLDLGAGYISIYSGSNNVYFDGFIINNMTNFYRKGIVIEPGNNIVLRRNTFHNLSEGGVGGSNNQSAIMIGRGTPGSYISFQDNDFYDIRHGYAIIAYTTNKVLVENNILHNFSGGTPGIGPKESSKMWFIRANKIYDMIETRAIWLNNSGDNTEDQEVSYNLVNTPSTEAALHVNQQNPAYTGKAYIFRNTFIGNVQFLNVKSKNGPFYVYNNVIVNKKGIDYVSCSMPSQIVKKDNLFGSSADGIVDSNGNLTSGYKSYLGTHGYQLGSETHMPSANIAVEANKSHELQEGDEGDEWEKWGEEELELTQVPYQTPELVWLPQGIDLTKRTKGPFTVKIRVEGIDKQKDSPIYPRIRYYIGTGSSHGYFEMIHEGDSVWRFDIPDPNWYKYRSNSLHYNVKLFDEEGAVISESRWEVELIDSFIQHNH